MQAVFHQAGNSVDYTPSTAKSSGDVVVQNNLVGVCETDIAADAKGALAIEGVFLFPCPSGEGEIEAGEPVYWDEDGDPESGTAGTGAATETNTGNVFLGLSVLAKDADDTGVYVKLVQTSPATPAGS